VAYLYFCHIFYDYEIFQFLEEKFSKTQTDFIAHFDQNSKDLDKVFWNFEKSLMLKSLKITLIRLHLDQRGFSSLA